MSRDNELINEIKNVIIDSLNLDGVEASDIGDDDALFGDGLGLDSIDALELGLAIKNSFQIDLDAKEDIKEYFQSVSSLVKLIQLKRESVS